MKKYISFVFILLIIISVDLNGQTYNFVNFTNNNGLPSLDITCISQDSLGFLFVGTQNGLSIFNGRKFKNFTKKEGLPDNYIVSIFPLDCKHILVSTAEGTVEFDGNTFRKLNLGKGIRQNIIESFLQDGDSTFLGSAEGVFVLKNNIVKKSRLFSSLKNRRIYTIVKKNKNTFLVGTDSGYALVKPNFTKFYLKDHIVKNIYFISQNSNKQDMWLTTNKGILRIKGRKIIRFRKLGGVYLPGNFYSAWYERDGVLWIGTHSGLIKFGNGKARVFTLFNGLPSNTINYLFKDNENALWVGTDRGLSRLANENVRLFNRRNNLSSPVWGIVETAPDEYLIGTDGTGLLKLQNNKITKFKLPGYSVNSVWGMFKDSENNIWMSTDTGLIKYSKDSVKIFKNGKYLNTDYIFSITEDKNNTIWLGSYLDGVYYYRNGSFFNINKKDGLLSNSVTALEVDKNNTLWVGTNKGISLIKNFKVKPFKFSGKLNSINVMDIVFDPEGNPFIATLDYGIYYINLKNNKITNISTDDGLSNNSVMFLAFDKDLTLWIGTNRGLNKFNYPEFKSTGKKFIKYFSSYDGFLSSEANQGSVLIDSQNKLLFATSEGLIKYDINKCVEVKAKPKLFVYKIDVNFKPFLVVSPYFTHEKVKEIKLDYDQNYVTFYYSALDLVSPSMLKYKYILKGFDDKFSRATENTSVTYNKLPPGNYEFVVEAIKNSDEKIHSVAKVKILIAAPFWKTSWFYILVAVFIALILYSFYLLRIRRLKKYTKELQKLYDEKVFYQKQLEESEKTYRELFEKSSDANLIIDPETFEIIDANHSAVRLYGYSLEKLKRMNLTELAVEPEVVEKNIKKVLEKGVATRLEAVHRKENGEIIQLSINASVVNYSGKSAILAIYTDVTKQKEIERKLKEAKESAEKSSRLKSEFLAQVSHEIRTPINNILNYTNLIKEELGNTTNSLLEMAFAAINRSSKRIIRTIDLILNMSELQRGTYEPSFKNIDLLKDVLMPLFEQYKYEAKDKNLNFELNSNVKEAKVFADEYTVIQIFDNLIENAIKYTKEGSVKLRLNYDIGNNNCIVEVKDTGIGISEEYIPYIFEPFSQEEQGYTRRFDGNGLGLSLVKSYCELNKAEIFVESKKGEGSVFRVKFSLN